MDKFKRMKEEQMTYSVVRYENKIIVYLADFLYEDMYKKLDSIISFFKTSDHYDEFYLLENETGKMVKLNLLEMKKGRIIN